MDYLYYLLVVVVVLALCARLFRPAADLPEHLRRGAADAGVDETQQRQALRRELRSVPTPWGWPGGQARSGRGVGGIATSQTADTTATALQIWVDRLIAEKRTKEDSEYLLRKDASLRALVEDRYGRSNYAEGMAYRKVSPAVLRDPAREHDQMDNFPGGRTEQIVSGLQLQPRSTRQTAELGNLKTPWGW